MRRFVLKRQLESKKMSTIDLARDLRMAEGILFSNGKCVIQWLGPYCSTVVWENFEQFCHISLTPESEIHWIDLE